METQRKGVKGETGMAHLTKKKRAFDLFQSHMQGKATAPKLAANSIRVSSQLQRKGGGGEGEGEEWGGESE